MEPELKTPIRGACLASGGGALRYGAGAAAPVDDVEQQVRCWHAARFRPACRQLFRSIRPVLRQRLRRLEATALGRQSYITTYQGVSRDMMMWELLKGIASTAIACCLHAQRRWLKPWLIAGSAAAGLAIRRVMQGPKGKERKGDRCIENAVTLRMCSQITWSTPTCRPCHG